LRRGRTDILSALNVNTCIDRFGADLDDR